MARTGEALTTEYVAVELGVFIDPLPVFAVAYAVFATLPEVAPVMGPTTQTVEKPTGSGFIRAQLLVLTRGSVMAKPDKLVLPVFTTVNL